MARRKVRSGVVSTIGFLNRQIAVAKKTIADCKVQIARLKRVDKRVRRLGSATTKKTVRRRSTKKSAPAKVQRPKLKSTMRGSGPNVCSTAYSALIRADKPMHIGTLAAAVIDAKGGGKTGANFVQNLGAALQKDKRFKRVSRGVYALK